MPKLNTSFGLSELERIKHANKAPTRSAEDISQQHNSNENQEKNVSPPEATTFFSVSLLGIKLPSKLGIRIHRVPHELKPLN